jgi:hypothetical protein
LAESRKQKAQGGGEEGRFAFFFAGHFCFKLKLHYDFTKL